jgi:hypothetical protein
MNPKPEKKTKITCLCGCCSDCDLCTCPVCEHFHTGAEEPCLLSCDDKPCPVGDCNEYILELYW